MHKFYKQRLYKKYNDEIWGRLISSKKFSYNKRSVLLNYRDKVVKNWFKIRTKYCYHRRGFLVYLKDTKYHYRNTRRRLKLLNFMWRRFLITSSLTTKLKRVTIKNVKKFTFTFRKYHYLARHKRKFYIVPERKSKIIFIKKDLTSIFRKNKASILLKLNLKAVKSFSACFSNAVSVRKSKTLLKTENYTPAIFPAIFSSKLQRAYRMLNFVIKSNKQYIIRKKLNLRRQKAFFYSVHIAAPGKKKKKWSLFAKKNIYYKKVSLFFGFKKVSSFFKLYNQVVSIWGKNQFQLFLMLEGRLEAVLLRLNFFPSIYFIKRFIASGNVFVNNKSITYPAYFLEYNEIVSIEKRYFKLIYYFLKSKLKSKKIFLNAPSFLEVDYKLLVAMLIRSPKTSDLTRPVSFNLYTKFLSFNR